MKIAMYDIEGFFLDVFEVDTITELEKQLQIPQGGINACLSRKSLTTNSLQFIEIKTESSKIFLRIADASKITVGHSFKKVHKYYKGRFIATYDNVSIASDLNGVSISNLSRYCNGIRKPKGIYTWEWAN
jgi:hypothetical protein